MTLNEKQLNSDNQWEKYVESGFDPKHEAPNAVVKRKQQRAIPYRRVVSNKQIRAIRIQER